MKWFPATRRDGPLCPTAASLRQTVGEPIKEDFDNPLSGTTQLQFTLKDVTSNDVTPLT